jgi:hypothetical protein
VAGFSHVLHHFLLALIHLLEFAVAFDFEIVELIGEGFAFQPAEGFEIRQSFERFAAYDLYLQGDKIKDDCNQVYLVMPKRVSLPDAKLPCDRVNRLVVGDPEYAKVLDQSGAVLIFAFRGGCLKAELGKYGEHGVGNQDPLQKWQQLLSGPFEVVEDVVHKDKRNHRYQVRKDHYGVGEDGQLDDHYHHELRELKNCEPLNALEETVAH